MQNGSSLKRKQVGSGRQESVMLATCQVALSGRYLNTGSWGSGERVGLEVHIWFVSIIQAAFEAKRLHIYSHWEESPKAEV